MIERRNALKLTAGALLGSQFGTAAARSDQDRAGNDQGEQQDIGMYVAIPTGGQQVPPVETVAQGAAAFAVTEDRSAVHYGLIVQAIENLTQAHIHQGSIDENGPVVAWLYPGPEAQEPRLIEGRHDGAVADGTITSENLTGPLEGESIETLLEAMATGNAYVNLHTEQNPAGEIRGQIAPAMAVVESLGLGQQPTQEEETQPTTEENMTG
ncbi:CHRD domain-containing protein [Natrinema sp. CBA1119]|uniref:CHRD domain-containing protein n=1 Tax=Natrinema sp. CBA1119 TaxID=1608465 RepID=UPI001C3F33C3|nr:CHRD domain-containing protein [Natrinema sp. CBA1119]